MIEELREVVAEWKDATTSDRPSTELGRRRRWQTVQQEKKDLRNSQDRAEAMIDRMTIEPRMQRKTNMPEWMKGAALTRSGLEDADDDGTGLDEEDEADTDEDEMLEVRVDVEEETEETMDPADEEGVIVTVVADELEGVKVVEMTRTLVPSVVIVKIVGVV